MASEIRTPQAWQEGRLKIDWVRHHMPLLNSLEEEFKTTLPFKGLKVALWTANDLISLNYCRALGVDYIESDVFGGN